MWLSGLEYRIFLVTMCFELGAIPYSNNQYTTSGKS
jgi:hypothetical protein